MDHLQACYFCGAAEDDPLREVTVTPRSRRDDPEAQVSLTLCRSCERKLERVLDGLFTHVESGRSADTANRSEPDDDGTASDGPIDQIDVGSQPSDAAADGEPSSAGNTPTAGQDDSGTTTAPGDGGGDATADEAGSDDDPRVTARATMTQAEGLDGISVEDYNRVMRLLQNRELPMERDAFVALATNAYEMRADEVDALLDEVIENGRLVVRDDQLVRPNDESSP